MPFVTIIMPCLDEEGYIEASVRSIAASASAFDHEIIVADGGSTDATLAILDVLRAQIPALKVVHNPGRLQSAGMNIGAEMSDARATILLRADCHSIYPPDFVAQCVRALETTQAASVVVPMFAVGDTPLQHAIAVAQNSRLGNGGSAHRSKGASGYVDHGHHAAFRKDIYLAVGGYDPRFSHNEDAELDHRIALRGGRVFMNAEALIHYKPRRSFGALARQYFRFGAGRARTVLKHRMRLKLRQMIPLAVGVVLVASLLAGIAEPLLLLVPLAYAGSLLAFALMELKSLDLIKAVRMTLAFGIIQLAWAAGFAVGLYRYRSERGSPTVGGEGSREALPERADASR